MLYVSACNLIFATPCQEHSWQEPAGDQRVKLPHQRDGQPSSSASGDQQQTSSAKIEAQDFTKCPWNMRKRQPREIEEKEKKPASVKEELQDEAWAADWAAELWEEENWRGVKQEEQDEAWAAEWAAEMWEADEKAWYAVKQEVQDGGLKAEHQDEALAADWAAETWEKGEKNGGVKPEPHDDEVKEEPQDEAWAVDWAAEIWEKGEKKVRWWDTSLHWLMCPSNLLTRV